MRMDAMCDSMSGLPASNKVLCQVPSSPTETRNLFLDRRDGTESRDCPVALKHTKTRSCIATTTETVGRGGVDVACMHTGTLSQLCAHLHDRFVYTCILVDSWKMADCAKCIPSNVPLERMGRIQTVLSCHKKFPAGAVCGLIGTCCSAHIPL